jgi:hypothetical protein
MPAAMVPRPWDFPVPEVPSTSEAEVDLLQSHGIIIPSGPLSKPANSIADIVANNNPAPTLKPTPTSPPKPASPQNLPSSLLFWSPDCYLPHLHDLLRHFPPRALQYYGLVVALSKICNGI